MKPARKQKLIIIGIVLTFSAILVALVLTALSQNINLFYTPTEILSGKIPQNKSFRSGGMVVEDSIKRNKKNLSVSFKITDYENTVTVNYTGILPDLFKEGQGVVVDGVISKTDNSITATEVLAKHDENYMPPPVADMLEGKKNKTKNTTTENQQKY